MTTEQRAKLLQRIAIDEKEKLSFKECEKIAKDLNLTVEQVKDMFCVCCIYCLGHLLNY